MTNLLFLYSLGITEAALINQMMFIMSKPKKKDLQLKKVVHVKIIKHFHSQTTYSWDPAARSRVEDYYMSKHIKKKSTNQQLHAVPPSKPPCSNKIG